MRGKERRKETSALDEDEFKMPLGFPGGIPGKKRYLCRVIGYESSIGNWWVKPKGR